MSIRRVLLASCLSCLASVVAAEGLALRDAEAAWPQWQARLSIVATGATSSTGSRIALVDAEPHGGPGAAIHGGALLGDYYLRQWTPRWLSRYGALRATSGLMVGTRSLAVAETLSSPAGVPRVSLAIQSMQPLLGPAEAGHTVPYLGVGYTGLSLKGGWGFTADLGVTAEHPTAGWRLGRAVLGAQGVDSAVRQLRLSPLLQLGVSYSF